MKNRRIEISFGSKINHTVLNVESNPLFTEEEFEEVKKINKNYIGKVLEEKLAVSFGHDLKSYFESIGENVSVKVVKLEDEYAYVGTQKSTLAVL